jgi:uncharacterized membrane protein HdeD (DUF308 family)
METQVERVTIASAPGRTRGLRGALFLIMGCLALLSPFFAGSMALFLVGLLLIGCGALEMLEVFQADDESGRRSAYLSGALSVLAGILLLAQPQLVLRGLSLFLAGTFLIDGIGKIVTATRARGTGHTAWKWPLLNGVIACLLAFVLAFRWPFSGQAVVACLVAVRMLAAGWSLLLGCASKPRPAATTLLLAQHPDARLGLPGHPEFAKLQASLRLEEEGRRRIDAAWCWTFVLVFFAIHIGRMAVTWDLVGMVSPLVAVLGDIGTALLLAFIIILPCRLAWRKMSRPLERRGWERLLARIDEGRGPGFLGRASRGWLVRRLRFSRRMARMRYSPRATLQWGLQVGLPVTAILVAVNPIWGFSWFFNSESWATEIWDRWAAQRSDIWREQMIRAVKDHYPGVGGGSNSLFGVAPEGVGGGADFSFLVLGDTGEGGAAQHSLRDQYLALGQRPDVKFLVISSDVIYPSGAMVDYEPKFYLPFKGFTKPIYAIPGNHDWYDALEAFAANFMEADAASASIHARVMTDNRLTTTTDKRIDEMIREASRLRQEYGVRTGWQRGPFFEMQTDRFALIAVDTGVLRRIDSDQWGWLRGALDRAQGKFVIAILGHPLFAGGRYQAEGEEPLSGEWVSQEVTAQVAGQRPRPETTPFAALHRVLREHHVPVVMAGDTHYFECYREHYDAGGTTRDMYHFVNGGGGAYMSIGTPLDWPREPAVADCGFYPRTDVVIDKLDRETPVWKRPLWLWAKYLQAWPLTAEAIAGAFLYNRAPYLQSFVEVRVENSKDQVRLIPHGAHGPLRWPELQSFGALVPRGAVDEDTVDFVIPMSRQPHSVPAQRPAKSTDL